MTLTLTKNLFTTLAVMVILGGAKAQDTDSLMIRRIYDEALTQHSAYEDLRYLTKKIGHRLTGSQQAEDAVQYTFRLMKQKGWDTVYLQPTKVRHWVRGSNNECKIIGTDGDATKLKICALGGSVPTPSAGITAQVIEVDSLSDLAKMGRSHIEGKIVFFNRPMDPRYIRTFTAYGKAVDQRSRGAAEASRYGAIGVIVRSMTLADNDSPHTGILHYDTVVKGIPAVAVSTHDANLLHDQLKKNQNLTVFLSLNCKETEAEESYNVIGEMYGSGKSPEVIAVGGHLDCWDLGEGAHDDGVGCMQSIEALRILNAVGYKPAHTIRCIMFMDEEIGQAGGRTYAKWSQESGQKHLAAIELDAGGATPLGFNINSDKEFFESIARWKPLLMPYNLWSISEGGGGVDISFLKKQNVPLISLSTDSQLYFDYHHCELDVFEAIHEREMQLGSAAVSTLIYLLDQQ
jgi:carboxypeptidase Q